MVITIYKVNASPPARAVLMTVEILGLKVETKEANPMSPEQFPPEIVEKNPSRTIPMIKDGDFILADSHVIITYLVSKYGAELRATLYPADLRIRATIDHRMYVDATLIFPKNRELVTAVVQKKATGPNDEQIAGVHETYGLLEKYLEITPFMASDHITLADVSVVSTISSLNVFVPIEPEKYPKIVAWWDKIKTQEWYQNANVPGLLQFEALVKGAMEKNSASN